MKFCLISILVFFGLLAHAQNLIPNPGFDSMNYCPTGFGQVNACISWYQSTNNLLPPHGTDYLSSCHTSTLSTPSNYWGYAVPVTAGGYMALSTMAPTLAVNYRENIYAALNSPLIPGHIYLFSAKVSRSDFCKYATNNFGVKLSTVTSFPINNVCAFSNSAVIVDTSLWTNVSGTFTADSAYTYICIGNFFDDANTVVATVCSSCSNPYYEYFIDDVSLEDQAKAEGIFEIKEKNFCKVFPNPNNGTFSIDLENASTVIVSDVLGNELFSSFFDSGFHTVILNTSAKGVYFLRLKEQSQIAKLCIY